MGTVRRRPPSSAGFRTLTPRLRARRHGMLAERLACDYLEQRGLKTVQRNFRTPRGEIDLVMLDGDILVFVEVRSRTSNAFMHAAESIDQRKRERIILAGQQFLQQYRAPGSATCRFDVMIVNGAATDLKIEWIKRAFDA